MLGWLSFVWQNWEILAVTLGGIVACGLAAWFTRNWKIAAIGLVIGAGVLLWQGAYTAGFSAANAKWEKKGLENQIRVLTVDAQIQRNVAELAKQSEAGLTAKTEQLETQIQEYAAHVETLKSTPACADARLATDDDVQRLRNIGGTGEVRRRPDRTGNPFRLRKSRP